MKRIYSFIICIGICGQLFAQVGINTSVPQGIFHVDAKNNTSGTANAGDDVVVLPNGNMGIGTLAPSVKLHIVSAVVGKGFALQDGTQGNGYVLVSDANGNAYWNDSGVSEFTVIPTQNSTTTSFMGSSFTYDPGFRLMFNKVGTYSISLIIRLTVNRAASVNPIVRVYLSPLSALLSFPGAAQVIGTKTTNNVYQMHINQNIEVNATTGLAARLIFSLTGDFTAPSGTLQAYWSGTHIRVK